ncbi:SLATT domain-containing protein [Methylobacterium sp. J-090]|uniref:SLATT domain-containing protein n=1 Tax=Methylobacterium sp. J-090 TaxID=2836666 RepID=UPI001FB95B64|nr:SLATT domain-containing protein [Methylobacterium sp. J-090]MCJ2084332.1 SLATT domain-containing protein [Methylobacterium sp. J-090]
MDKDLLLKTIAEKGYDVAFGVKKTFATYDIVGKGPGWVGIISSAVGIFALIYDPLSAKVPSAILLIAGIASLYLSFYRAEEYENAANKLLHQYNKLKSLYRSVQSGQDTTAAKIEFDTIDVEYYSTTIGRQVFLSGWYAHYKLFAETQIDWMDEQLHFTWKDKVPLSAQITIVVLAIAIIVGVGWWIAQANFCR